MIVKILGHGSAHTTSSIGTTFVVDGKILVETPPSIAKKFIQGSISIMEIETIFISHLHGDHFFGLPIFLLERRMYQPQKELNIYGPKDLREYNLKMLKLGFPENDYDTFFTENKINFHDIEEVASVKCGTITVAPMPVLHNSKTFGLSICFENGKKLLYSADTAYFDELGEAIKNADICFLDATSRDTPISWHMCYNDINDFSVQYPEKVFYVMHRGGYDAAETHNLKMPAEFDEVVI
ncbi:MAG: ribonuclease Z [Defluviitaleaceae bacterium]|nr:ribonuclease Z [Defluviitaleaceae bacterium]